MSNPILLAIVVILVVFAAVVLISGFTHVLGSTIAFGSPLDSVVVAIIILVIAAAVYWFANRVA